VIERFLADTASRYGFVSSLEQRPSRSERVAIIGAGPSGLAAAYFLARLGYGCDVFEAQPEPGGILRWGIPTYRLPLSVLKNEIAIIESLGVCIQCGVAITGESIEKAGDKYAAVFLGCGHGRGQRLGIPGEDLPGVADGLRFLEGIRRREAQPIEGLAAVIGGGNTAIDVACSVRRLGGRAVLIYRRRQQDMRAFADEIAMALDEGVTVMELYMPAGIETSPKGFVLTLQAMRVAEESPGTQARVEPEAQNLSTIEVQHVFIAIGAEESESWMHPPSAEDARMALNHSVVICNPQGPLTFFGGDLIAATKSVVHAVASGKEAAITLDVILRDGLDAVPARLAQCSVGNGSALSMEMYLHGPRCRRNPHLVDFAEINSDYFQFAARIVQPRLLREERLQSFAEIGLRISANLAMREADRCFNCGICNQCDNCHLFCPDVAVKHDESNQGRHIDYDFCKGCGLCVVECPRHAMSLEEEPG
jgi:NADPH-dependent glutamate synthase beta subunit-like oxidoreductase